VSFQFAVCNSFISLSLLIPTLATVECTLQAHPILGNVDHHRSPALVIQHEASRSCSVSVIHSDNTSYDRISHHLISTDDTHRRSSRDQPSRRPTVSVAVPRPQPGSRSPLASLKDQALFPATHPPSA
jgi:hypothetical protein